MSTPTYLLDTNILVHLIRADNVGERIRQTYQPLLATPTPASCIVTEGELRSLALQWNWGARKKSQMDFLLGYFWRFSIDAPAIFEAYAAIDAYCEAHGLVVGKNDLWIAATAFVSDATLVTTDKDFLPLQSDFISVAWLDPALEKRANEP